MTKREAISYLCIPDKHFENYFNNSGEIEGFKKRGKWFFDKTELNKWNVLRKKRTVALSLKEYEKCFEFAIKMAYSSSSSHGTGIRGARSEMQVADDFILGILAEHGLKKFLKNKFNLSIKLDMAVHPGKITPQDIVKIKKYGKWSVPRLNIAVKSSKMKSCFNVIDPLEYRHPLRKSDVYIFVRVDLPSDHLFRILREHSFFKKVKNHLEQHNHFRKIKELREINVWVCGFSWHGDFKRRKSIPGQPFNGFRYVCNVKDMHNSDKDWGKLLSKL